MTTQERIQHLVETGQAPDFLGDFTHEDLTTWIVAELGHSDALDNFTDHGSLLSKAVAPANILHIVSGNTPHAAVQSLFRGLLLGSQNQVKIPSAGLPELLIWIAQLSKDLQNLIKVKSTLHEDDWKLADAVIAIGSDQTIAAIQKKITSQQIFIPHGHKISIGIVSSDWTKAATLAAKDASLYNQRGCLSPHAIYVKKEKPGDAMRFAENLAQAMDNFAQISPPEPLNLSEAGAVRNLRETTRFTAANSDDCALWESSNSLHWTVIYESATQLKLSCLNRCIYVKPLPNNLNEATLGSEIQHLSTIAIHPFNLAYAESLTTLPAHRICPLGQSQQPSLLWHHDGFAPLASLIRWKDLG